MSLVLVGSWPFGDGTHFFRGHGLASARGTRQRLGPVTSQPVQVPVLTADQSHPEEVIQLLDKSQDEFRNLLLPNTLKRLRKDT